MKRLLLIPCAIFIGFVMQLQDDQSLITTDESEEITLEETQ